jgi:CRISPR-associated endonuclease/helicase Cas3
MAKRLNAVKKMAPAPMDCRTPEGLAEFIKASHTPGMQTLVVVNRVTRARETFIALEKLYGLTPARGRRSGTALVSDTSTPELHLLHSRFRPHERKAWMQFLSHQPDERGRIIVATQVIEAGVDLSSQLLITDLAPYASLVQRFGRCNRAGELTEARIFWIDRPLNAKDGKLATQNDLDGKEQARVALPYTWRELNTARELLTNMQSAAPLALPSHHDPFSPAHILRRRDLLDLFDTTQDLSGYDLDISRFVRGGDERDVSVAWRKLGASAPQPKTPRPVRDELCPVALGDLRTFLKGKDASGKPRQAWVWNALDGTWQKLSEGELRPGLVLLLDATTGGLMCQHFSGHKISLVFKACS